MPTQRYMRVGSKLVPLLGGGVELPYGSSTPPPVDPAPTDPTPDPAFTLGDTLPTKLNTGARIDTVPYTGPGAGATLTVNTAGATYSGLDFGSTKVVVAAADVSFTDCTWRNTKKLDGGLFQTVNATRCKISFCTFENADQSSFLSTGVVGQQFTMDRCQVIGFGDGVDPRATTVGGNMAVTVRGSYIGELGWWASPVVSYVHGGSTSYWTHNDAMQIAGGTGLTVVGNSINGLYSTTVGTGTPNSGNEFTGDAKLYNQADGEAKRREVVAVNANNTGGSLACLMFNVVQGANQQALVTDNWLGGGGIAVNARDANTTGTVGTFLRNRLMHNQRYGDSSVISVYRNGTAVLGTGADKNYFIDTGAEVFLEAF